MLDGLRDERQRGEVEHRIEAAAEPFLEGMGVVERQLQVGRAGRDRRTVAAAQIVQHDDLVTGVQQLCGDDRAHVARAARDEGPHRRAS